MAAGYRSIGVRLIWIEFGMAAGYRSIGIEFGSCFNKFYELYCHSHLVLLLHNSSDLSQGGFIFSVVLVILAQCCIVGVSKAKRAHPSTEVVGKRERIVLLQRQDPRVSLLDWYDLNCRDLPWRTHYLHDQKATEEEELY
ncbi:hypothetical protein Fmac_001644 [Flemingia macrophylla]|uniref:Uncharacterized protein n=1 Tax=Flemingia macrophylla TaxID=520843 RepID=A0ABD1NHR5_9FABA